MSINEIRIGDTGIQLNITILDQDKVPVPLNLSSATIVFRKADNTKMTVNAALLTDGNDGKIKYQFQPGDLNVVGPMVYQVKITNNFGNVYTSDIGEIRIENNL